MISTSRTELLEQHGVLAGEYIRLLNDKDVLLNWGKPQLEALYTTRIGIYQVELLQLQLRIKALKRKLEKARAAIQRGELVNFGLLDEEVENELAEAKAEILWKVSQVESAQDMLANLASPTRSAELRKLYREMAKMLHPDVNPALTAGQRELWLKVGEAYKSADLEQLKALKIVFESEINQAAGALDVLTEDELALRLEVLKEGIKTLMMQIDVIRAEFPFTLEYEIRNEEWVASKVAEVQESIEKHCVLEVELMNEYEALKHAEA